MKIYLWICFGTLWLLSGCGPERPKAERPKKEVANPPQWPVLSPVTLYGKEYPARLINGKIWMVKNLDYPLPETSLCLDGDSVQCQKYGRLYSWVGANQACQGAGWRLPSKEDWNALFGSFEDDGVAFGALIVGGSSGFNAMRGGGFNPDTGEKDALGAIGSYWSSTEQGINYAWKFAFRSNRSYLFVSRDVFRKGWYFSCRCVKDQPKE